LDRVGKDVGVTEKLEVRESSIYGLGCFAVVPFAARRKIALYAGELLRGRRRIEARLRGQDAIKVIRLADDLAIDGAAGGDETAFINHSCEPNAFMRNVPGAKVAFFALRDILAGEEITVDYRDPDHPKICRCGAEKCRSAPRRSG
jgi:SET domain-containing protein